MSRTAGNAGTASLFVAIATLWSAASLVTAPVSAQDDAWQAIPWSQRAAVMQRVAYTDVRVTYSRPVARGRTLFGGVVDWGRIWNPGADSATTIELSDSVRVEGHPLAAGRYTLWVIPRADAPWTVIFSRRVDIFHSPYPGEEHDVLRFDVTPVTGEPMEVLAFYFPVVAKDGATLRLHWGETVLPIRMQMRTEP